MKKRMLAVILAIIVLMASYAPYVSTAEELEAEFDYSDEYVEQIDETYVEDTETADDVMESEPDLTAEPTPVPTVEPTPVPTPVATPVPTPEPTPEPTHEPTAEPTPVPTPESTPETIVTAEPTQTAEPTATVEATMLPTAEATIEPSYEPTIEPTAEPTPVPPMGIDVSLNSRYAFAQQDTAKLSVRFWGGQGPYTVVVTASGAVEDAQISTHEEAVNQNSTPMTAKSLTYSWKPQSGGVIDITVYVYDSRDKEVKANIQVLVPVDERESEEEWDASVGDIELTGDWRVDIINVARTQLGYRESSVNFIIDETGRQCGYTRYGDWFGANYSGWCGMFVSFCLKYAEIESWQYPRESNPENYRDLLRYAGAYEPKDSGYEPNAGDLIFFSAIDDTVPIHVGIVEKVTGSWVYTIEGNDESRVKQNRYKLNDDTIVGYGNTTELMRRAGIDVNEPIPELPRNGVQGTTSAEGVNLREEPSELSDAIRYIRSEGSPVHVNNAQHDNAGRVWYNVRYKNSNGYVRGDYLEFTAPDIRDEIHAIHD